MCKRKNVYVKFLAAPLALIFFLIVFLQSRLTANTSISEILQLNKEDKGYLCAMKDNLQPMLYKLDEARKKLIKQVESGDLKFELMSNVTILDESHDALYWQKIQTTKHITVLSHNCSIGNPAAPDFCGFCAVKKYYRWGAKGDTCFTKNTPVYEMDVDCRDHWNTDLRELTLPEIKTNNSLLPTFFIHVLTKSFIDIEGNVQSGNTRIISNHCYNGWKGIGKQQIHVKEVFIISQHYGEETFHGPIESIPRMAPYIDFLKKHDNILILVKSKTKAIFINYIDLLQINRTRLITGPVKADIVYLPQGSACSRQHQGSGDILKQMFFNMVKKPQHRNVILIIRHVHRWLRQSDNDKIVKYMTKKASEYQNIAVKILNDRPLPSFADIIQMFRGAIIVVTPHGAGLGNIMFLPEGAFVFEIHTRTTPNFCFKRISVINGVHYEAHMSLAPKISHKDQVVNLTALFQSLDKAFKFHGNVTT